MTSKDPFLEGTFWDKSWRPTRCRALLFTPERCGDLFAIPWAIGTQSYPLFHMTPVVSRGVSSRKHFAQPQTNYGLVRFTLPQSDVTFQVSEAISHLESVEQ